jgi:hypothetical protein
MLHFFEAYWVPMHGPNSAVVSLVGLVAWYIRVNYTGIYGINMLLVYIPVCRYSAILWYIGVPEKSCWLPYLTLIV